MQAHTQLSADQSAYHFCGRHQPVKIYPDHGTKISLGSPTVSARLRTCLGEAAAHTVEDASSSGRTT